jgi:hypothetical protein
LVRFRGQRCHHHHICRRRRHPRGHESSPSHSRFNVPLAGSATSGHKNAGSLVARPCRVQVLYVAAPSVAWDAWSANLEPIFTRCVAAQMPNGPQSCLQSNLPRKPRRKRPAVSLAASRSWGRLARVTELYHPIDIVVSSVFTMPAPTSLALALVTPNWGTGALVDDVRDRSLNRLDENFERPWTEGLRYRVPPRFPRALARLDPN